MKKNPLGSSPPSTNHALYAVIVIGLNGDIEQHHWQRRMKLRITTLIRFQEYTHAVHQLTDTMLRHVVMVLAYFGQAAYLMKNKEHVSDAFYRAIPGAMKIAGPTVHGQFKEKKTGNSSYSDQPSNSSYFGFPVYCPLKVPDVVVDKRMQNR
ncbi:hypothetical protein DCAR_0934245 [Daucus carota subsp. sativus]|uniref:Uncharacterized protein n=1 Tax=Daucus carota subsp. sativus TaxID=79200 RepID=A0A175YFZ2_DAUCS|nr:hypothetical protein DCAR_0934245 [Daucus carota subsp. sativus]